MVQLFQMPAFGAPYGHQRYSVMVPFIPRHFHADYFVDSRTLGYDYDNWQYGAPGNPVADYYSEVTWSPKVVSNYRQHDMFFQQLFRINDNCRKVDCLFNSLSDF